MLQAILECRWAQTCEARVLNATASEANQLRNNVATEKQSKYFLNFLYFLKHFSKMFKIYIEDRKSAEQKKKQFSDFFNFYF